MSIPGSLRHFLNALDERLRAEFLDLDREMTWTDAGTVHLIVVAALQAVLPPYYVRRKPEGDR
jgi:hypothetical protein